MIRVSGESKSRIVKAAGAESCGQRRNQKLHAAVAKHSILGALFEVEMLKNCTPLWREAHFQVKMQQKFGVRSTFFEVEKLHAAAARSTFPSQNVEKLRGSEHFLKLRC